MVHACDEGPSVSVSIARGRSTRGHALRTTKKIIINNRPCSALTHTRGGERQGRATLCPCLSLSPSRLRTSCIRCRMRTRSASSIRGTCGLGTEHGMHAIQVHWNMRDGDVKEAIAASAVRHDDRARRIVYLIPPALAISLRLAATSDRSRFGDGDGDGSSSVSCMRMEARPRRPDW